MTWLPRVDRGRARGALLGLAVGDALGTTLEFVVAAAPAYPALATGPHVDVTGGGPFEVEPGQVTDDTHMASCVAQSLLARAGVLDLDDVAARYLAWQRHAFDIGGQTAAALRRIAAGTPAGQAGLAIWLDGGRHAAGNGSLMRCAPLAVAYADRAGELAGLACAESAITHADPRCQLACAAFTAAIAAAVRADGPVDRAGMLVAARAGLGQAVAVLLDALPSETALIGRAAAQIGADLDTADDGEPGVHGADFHLQRTMGFVRVALRLAFWHLGHGTSWRDALIDVANRGGDADTNGAICGALLGAADGEDAIPAAWRARVLGALAGAASPFATTYHPTALLALVP